VYEALNLASLWRLPQLFVCENNLYAQSTPQAANLAGSIGARAAAFGLELFECDTWNLAQLFETAARAIEFVRSRRAPAFLLVRTYRLNAHSKGDDDRAQDEVRYFAERDPLARILRQPAWQQRFAAVVAEVDRHVDASTEQRLTADRYALDQLPRDRAGGVETIRNEKVRMVQALNSAYRKQLESGALMLGEDIADPYGGAFKVTRGLSTAFPNAVLTTPISEAAITGFAIGVALRGRPAFVEIMFGDFITHVFDQLISNASKFHHMYGFQATVPVRIRTPMGGKRGYGPTHSQSLEKFVLGIDNLAVVALTSLDDPERALSALAALPGPAFIVESKVDYGNTLWQGHADFESKRIGGPLGTLLLSPRRHAPTATVVAYGETARHLADHLVRLFVEADCVAELVVPLVLHPLELGPIEHSLRASGNLIVVEDGSSDFGFGAELLARLLERGLSFKARRIGASPVPVPSVAVLEAALLPTIAKVIAAVKGED